ncbi:F-box/WD repeat-containing protein 4 [Epargyreus clarus]|uniref:F-box/WD repeat-containing protein 4 n=1 Tax=Epargyreus clarus TaxID=520877 RepID=UPI003C300D75
MIEYSLLCLPYDVLINIIKKLRPQDLRNLMITCKTLRDLIINESAIWKWVFRNKLVFNVISKRNLQPLSYYNQCRLSNNWCKGIYRNKLIVQHHANYMPWLKLHNSEALFLSFRSNLKCYLMDKKGFPNCRQPLWNIEVPKVMRNDVRTNDISRFIVKDNVIVCGNRDGSSAIYTYTANRKPNLLYHIRNCHHNGEVEVSAVEFISSKSNPCVITSSGYTSELSLWYWKWRENDQDPMPQLEHHIFDCNTDASHPVSMGLRCLAVNESQDKLAIGLNRNSKPLLLDITTCYLLTKADDTRNARQVIRDIQWHNENTIAFVTHFGTLQLIDVRTNSVVYETTDPFQSSLYCVKSDGDHAIVVGSSEYSRCVLYDSRFKNHVQIYFTQKTPSPIYSLDFDSTKLIAAADRSTASLNFNVHLSTTQVRDYSHSFEVVQNR